MQTAGFAENIDQLAQLAQSQRCALMCAKAVPSRCHCALIADALLVRGVRADDIIGLRGRKPHVLTSFAKVEGLQLIYAPPACGRDTGAPDARDGRVGSGDARSAEPAKRLPIRPTHGRTRACVRRLGRANPPPSHRLGILKPCSPQRDAAACAQRTCH